MTRWSYKLRLRFRSLFKRSRVEQELSDEVRFHLEKLIEERVAKGLTGEQARYAALRELGRIEQIKEECRDMRRVNYIENFIQDIRYGLRTLVKRPGFTSAAVIALALGIGANTAIFSVVNGVLLRSLPYRDPDHLVVVSLLDQKSRESFPLCDADFLDWRAQNHVFSSIAAFSGSGYNLTGSGAPTRILGDVVTADFFSTLGVKPLVGRTFLPNEDRPGSPRLVVQGYSLWMDRYGSNPDIVGQSIVLNGLSTTVIGVMPAHFLPRGDQQLWTNLVIKPPSRRGPYYLTGEARLKPGATIAQARAELATLARRIEAQNPLSNSHMAFQVTPLEEAIVGNVRPALLVLLGAVVFVLLIASADVANLLLARAAAREKEFAVRTALGASRARLISQLLTESVLLGAVGGLFGLALARWGVKLLLALSPNNLPRLQEIEIDGRVLLFTCLISLASGILFGLAPAMHSRRVGLNESLKEGGRGGTEGQGRSQTRDLLVVAEIAMSFVLLVCAGLMLRSFHRLETVRSGVDPSNVLTMEISLPEQTYKSDDQIREFYQQLIAKVEALPGVASAGIGMSLPPNLLSVTDYFTVEGQPAVSERELGLADLVFVSPDYFRALGVSLLKGRNFTDQDRQDSTKVAIINQTLARRYWPNENPIGKRLKLGGAERPNSPWLEIVGVVGDIKYSGLDAPPEMAMYEPYQQFPWSSMYLVVRTSGHLDNPAAMTRSVQNVVWSLDKDVPVAHVRTMEQLFSESVGQPRFRTVLLGIFATIALSLAVVGIYGVLAYSVAQRTHEIGVRVALGAKRSDVLKLVMGHGLKLTLLGVGIGIAGSLTLTRFLSSMLYDVKPTDPVTFAGVAVALTVVALLASCVPTLRATKVDPMVALRYE